MKVTRTLILTIGVAAGNPQSDIVQAIVTSILNSAIPSITAPMKTSLDAVTVPSFITGGGPMQTGFMSLWKRVGLTLVSQTVIPTRFITDVSYRADQWTRPTTTDISVSQSLGMYNVNNFVTGSLNDVRIWNSAVLVSPNSLGFTLTSVNEPPANTNWNPCNVLQAPIPTLVPNAFDGQLPGFATTYTVTIKQEFTMPLPYTQGAVGSYAGLTLVDGVPISVDINYTYAGTPSEASTYVNGSNATTKVLVLPISTNINNSVTTGSQPLAVTVTNIGAGTPPPAITASIIQTLSTEF